MNVSIGTYGVVPVALAKAEGVNLNALKLYIALSSFQGNGGNCWPSKPTIVERSSVTSHSGYQTGMNWLIDNGWVEVERRGKGLRNLYRVLVPVSSPDIPENGTSDIPESGTSVYITKYPNEINTRLLSKKPSKIKHKTLGVPMNQTRYDNLCAKYGKDKVDGVMEAAVDWAAANGRPIKDYAALAATFIRRDEASGKMKPESIAPVTFGVIE